MPQPPPIARPRFRFRRGALEPQGLWVEEDDVLLFRTLYAGPALGAPLKTEARARIMGPRLVPEDFRLEQVRTNASPGEMSSAAPLTPGFLTGASIAPSEQEGAGFPGLHQPGLLYAQLSIGKGAPTPFYQHTLLAAGYVTALSCLGWPGGRDEVIAGGPGFPRGFIAVDPAAGGEINPTSIAQGIGRLSAFSFTFTTSAAAANREVAVLIRAPGAGIVYLGGANVVQLANQTRRYSCGVGLDRGQVRSDSFAIPIPADMLLDAGGTIETSTLNLQGADQFSGIAGAAQGWTA